MLSITGANTQMATHHRNETAGEPSATLFVVDPDVAFRKSLANWAKEAGWAAYTFDCRTAFLDCPPQAGPSCLVLDVGGADTDGLRLQALLARERIQTPIIIITDHADVSMSVQAMKAGAVEFLVKPFANAILLNAIGEAIERSRAVVRQLADRQALEERHDALSPRERQVMALAVAGLMNKQIAFELGISEITVKAHRRRMMGKMEARSFADLVRMSGRLGLS